MEDEEEDILDTSQTPVLMEEIIHFTHKYLQGINLFTDIFCLPKSRVIKLAKGDVTVVTTRETQAEELIR
jgi:hypothetical protein